MTLLLYSENATGNVEGAQEALIAFFKRVSQHSERVSALLVVHYAALLTGVAQLRSVTMKHFAAQLVLRSLT